MQLTLNEIINYIPHGVEICYEKIVYTLDAVPEPSHTEFGVDVLSLDNAYKLIEFSPSASLALRPLYYLRKEITHKGETFVPFDVITENYDFDHVCEYDFVTDWSNKGDNIYDYIDDWIAKKEHNLHFLPYGLIEKLYEWHFDVHFLIDKGLAVNKINVEEFKKMLEEPFYKKNQINIIKSKN